MCGINGIYSHENINVIDDRIKMMNSSIKHRGPDAVGVEIISDKIGFGHRRLSIIDVDNRSNQPMYSSSKKNLIVYNGEIFNYLEIKKELYYYYDFITNSDTEVILAAYEIKGIDWFLEKANGMFAFAIYNLESNKLLLARDRFGIKPLYFYKKSNSVVFSSEIKGILHSGLVKAEFNYSAIDEYLGNRFVREPFTFFNDIFQVNSATYVIFTENETPLEIRYWSLPKMNFDKQFDEEILISMTQIEIENAVKRWMLSDVKVGAYLSGGVDSSLLSALLSLFSKEKINTYSIGFSEEGFNEFEFARKVAEIYKTCHNEILFNFNEYFHNLEKLIYFKDAPLSVPNEVPLAIMSDLLSKDVKVVLSGEGADELFGGYGKIYRSAFDFQNQIKTQEVEFYDYFIGHYEYVPRSTRDKYLKNEKKYRTYFDQINKNDFESNNNEENIFRFFHNNHIKGLLQRVDMTTMQTSVEARPPFLDHELIEFVYQKIPYDLKLKWNSPSSMEKAKYFNANDYSENLDTPKYILKKISEKYLPKEIIYRKKMGFPVPLSCWYDEITNLTKDYLVASDWLHTNSTDMLFQELKTSERSGQLLWMFLNIEIFKITYFNKKWIW